ncbi:MAG: winged helix DNA-binding domain-containing protein [Gaiellaceae bacterium]
MSKIIAGQVRAFRLARHHLTDPLPAERLEELVAAVGGVQAQVASAAELAIWARSRGLSPGQVQEALWERRSLVKTWCMRGTLHLLPAHDHALWAAALARSTRWRARPWLKAFGVTIEELESFLAALDAGLSDEGKTREEVAALAPSHLRKELLRGWGTLLKPAAYQGVLAFGPNRGRNVTFVHPRAWLGGTGRPPDGDEAAREILRRFLRAYGPATPDDFARWWGGGAGGTTARRLLESIAGELEEVDAEGRRAWVLAGDTELLRSLDPPRSVHLLPNFDVYTLHYRPRDAFLPAGAYDRIYRVAGWISPVVLYDGAVAGVWEQKKRARRVELRVELLARDTKRLRAGIAREAKRLAEFLELPVDVL